MSDRLKCAVVGCAWVGESHAEGYVRNKQAELVAVCDVIPEAAERLAGRFGVPAFTSVEKMMEQTQPELVSVATSWDRHYEPTLKALQAGAHVLCEKPLAQDSATAAKMVQAAEEARRRLAVDFNYRFIYTTKQVRRLLQEGALGNLAYLYWRLTIGNPADFNPYYHLVALHTHSFDQAEYLGGRIRRLQAFMAKPSGRPHYTTCAINLEFGGECIGSIIGSYDMTFAQPIARLEMGGTRGQVVVDDLVGELRFLPHSTTQCTEQVWRRRVMVRNDFVTTFYDRIDRFIENILRDEPTEASGADGLRALELVEAAIRSFETGQVVGV